MWTTLKNKKLYEKQSSLKAVPKIAIFVTLLVTSEPPRTCTQCMLLVKLDRSKKATLPTGIASNRWHRRQPCLSGLKNATSQSFDLKFWFWLLKRLTHVCSVYWAGRILTGKRSTGAISLRRCVSSCAIWGRTRSCRPCHTSHTCRSLSLCAVGGILGETFLRDNLKSYVEMFYLCQCPLALSS